MEIHIETQDYRQHMARYRRKYNGEGEDIFQEMAALAVKKFNPARGVPFLGYAATWENRALSDTRQRMACVRQIQIDVKGEKQMAYVKKEVPSSIMGYNEEGDEVCLGDTIPSGKDLEDEFIDREEREIARKQWEIVSPLIRQTLVKIRQRFKKEKKVLALEYLNSCLLGDITATSVANKIGLSHANLGPTKKMVLSLFSAILNTELASANIASETTPKNIERLFEVLRRRGLDYLE